MERNKATAKHVAWPLVPGSCLVSFHFLWGQLSTGTVHTSLHSWCPHRGLGVLFLRPPFAEDRSPPTAAVVAISFAEGRRSRLLVAEVLAFRADDGGVRLDLISVRSIPQILELRIGKRT